MQGLSQKGRGMCAHAWSQNAALVGVLVAVFSVQALAVAYPFQGVEVDVDAWVGTGSQETILVVDWNRIDLGYSTISESHAFGYRWDGIATELDMLTDFDTAGIFSVTFGGGGAFVSDIIYDDTTELHQHIEPGSWGTGSTSDPYADWGEWGNTEWDYNTGGIDVELLADGQFEGISALMFFEPLPPGADTQLDIPIVPEPATAAMMAAASLMLLTRSRRHTGLNT